MTISIQRETLSTCLAELKVLFPEHYKELALNQDKVALDPIYEDYEAMENANQLYIATVREDGLITAYFVGFVKAALHYRTCLQCTMDIFYVKQDKRGAFLGVKLFQFVKRELKILGVQRWWVGSKVHKNAISLFTRIGFSKEPSETYHCLWLGD